MRYPDLFQRLLANSFESETYSYKGTPCWEWTGQRQRRGYGRFTKRVEGQAYPVKISAHRAMAELAVGRVLHPVNETIQHACSIPWCVHWLHFEIASLSENTQEMWDRTRGLSPRKQLRPLIDLDVYTFDPMIRGLPILRSTLIEECPF